jgi:hypothetical protein
MQSTSLIIVNFNTEAHVLAALAEIAARPEELPGQIIVVDNSPENGLSTQLIDLDVDVDYVPTSRNIGFAGGVNRGLARSSGRFVILLNPDARPEANCLAGLVKMLDEQPDIAVAAPALLPFDLEKSPVPSATRCDPSLMTTMIEYTALRRLMADDWLKTNYFVMPGSETEPIDCAMVQGACFAFRRSWEERVGGFDDGHFFLYWEETDFCRRIRNQGGRVVYCPQLSCRHLGGASLSEGGQDIQQFWQSLYSYHGKHRGLLAVCFLRLLLITGMTVEWLILRLLSCCRGRGDAKLQRDMARVRAQLIEQFHYRRQQKSTKA